MSIMPFVHAVSHILQRPIKNFGFVLHGECSIGISMMWLISVFRTKRPLSLASIHCLLGSVGNMARHMNHEIYYQALNQDVHHMEFGAQSHLTSSLSL